MLPSHKTNDCEEEEEEIWSIDWKSSDLAWQIKEVHPLLLKHEQEITGGRSSLKVLVPLCGISVDMVWFADRGHSVVGVEYNEEGCKAFFEINNIDFDTQPLTEEFKIFKGKSKDITLFQCDFFKISNIVSSLKGSFDVIWDRAALRTTVGQPAGQDEQAYVDVLRELVAPSGLLAQENTRFDIRDCKTEYYPPVVTDEMMEKLAKEKWSIKKLDQLEYKVGEGIEPFYREYNHNIALHILTPK